MDVRKFFPQEKKEIPQKDETSLSTYLYNGKTLRIFGTHEKPMFLAKEVGELLGIKNYRDFVSTLDLDEKGVEILDTPGGSQKMTLISESALYRFIMRSNKPDAVIFQKWVCKEVLPSIRQNGTYELKLKIENMEKQIKNLQYIGEKKKRIKVSQRLVDLGHIGHEEIRILLKEYKTTNGQFVYYFSDRKIIINHCKEISKLINSEKKKKDGTYAPLDRKDKGNLFTIEDYENFGDNVIETYLQNNPIVDWKIDWEHLIEIVNLNFSV